MNLTSPKNWKTVDLSALASFSNGKSSPDRFEDGGYPVYGANGIIGFTDNKNSDKDSIIIGRVGSYCGSLYFSENESWVTDNAIICKAKENSDPKFIFYLLNTLNLNSRAAGSGQPLINQSILGSIEVIAPETKEEQKEIAAILGSFDDKIELLRSENKTLENIAQTLFKEWFVDFKLPGHEKTKIVDGIPEGWKVGKLGDVAFVTKGTTPTTIGGNFVDKGINFIKAESITEQHGFLLSKFSFIDEYTNYLLSRSIIQAEDVLYTIAGTIGRFALITKDLVPANTNQAVAIIRANQEIVDPYYLRCYFGIESVKESLTGSVVEAVQANLSLGSIKDCKILIPDNAGMKLFIEKIKPLFLKADLHNIEIQTLSRLRDDLLNKIFS